MAWNLSSGSIQSIEKRQQVPNPTLQVLEVKKLDSKKPPERHRLILSDGLYSLPALGASQLNPQIKALQPWSVITLKDYTINDFKGKGLLIVLNFDDMGSPGNQIGNPTTLNEIGGGVAPAASPQTTVAKPAAKAAPKQYAPQGKPGAKAAPQRRGEAFEKVMPVKSLSLYNMSAWKIKVRVASKTPMKNWNKNGKEGKLFSCVLIDGEGGEIRATAFNKVADDCFALLEVDKVYYIEKGSIKQANKQFSGNVHNDYEITLESQTTIVPANDDDNSIPNVIYKFVKIADLPTYAKDDVVDVLGIIMEVSALDTINTKKGTQTSKRSVLLWDHSLNSISLTLWGDAATQVFKEEQSVSVLAGTIMAIKGARVGEFGGRSLNSLHDCHVELNPDIPEGHELAAWFGTNGSRVTFDQLNPLTLPKSRGDGAQRKQTGDFNAAPPHDQTQLVAAIPTLNIDPENKKGENFWTRATISRLIDDKFYYTACPGPKCNKKVNPAGAVWNCPTCDVNWEKCEYRYILSVQVRDHSGSYYVSCFGKVAEDILGHPANYLAPLKDTNINEFSRIMSEAQFKSFNFQIKATVNVHQDKQNIRATANTAEPTSAGFIEASSQLIDKIRVLQQS